MEAATHEHHHHELPTSGRALTNMSISATLHCLTGCAIGEVAGMAIGTALGFSNFATVALAISLAFVFGYSLTSLPLLRAGFALSAVVPIALASDTLSIADDGDRRQRDRRRDPGRDARGARRAAVLGLAGVRPRDRVRVRRPRQPVPARARQGPRGRAQHGHPRRAAGQGRRRDRRAGVRLRLQRPGRRGDRRGGRRRSRRRAPGAERRRARRRGRPPRRSAGSARQRAG